MPTCVYSGPKPLTVGHVLRNEPATSVLTAVCHPRACSTYPVAAWPRYGERCLACQLHGSLSVMLGDYSGTVSTVFAFLYAVGRAR